MIANEAYVYEEWYGEGGGLENASASYKEVAHRIKKSPLND